MFRIWVLTDKVRENSLAFADGRTRLINRQTVVVHRLIVHFFVDVEPRGGQISQLCLFHFADLHVSISQCQTNVF